MAGEVVDLLDGDAKVQQPRDKGMAEVTGSDMAEAGSLAAELRVLQITGRGMADDMD